MRPTGKDNRAKSSRGPGNRLFGTGEPLGRDGDRPGDGCLSVVQKGSANGGSRMEPSTATGGRAQAQQSVICSTQKMAAGEIRSAPYGPEHWGDS